MRRGVAGAFAGQGCHFLVAKHAHAAEDQGKQQKKCQGQDDGTFHRRYARASTRLPLLSHRALLQSEMHLDTKRLCVPHQKVGIAGAIRMIAERDRDTLEGIPGKFVIELNVQVTVTCT